MKKLNMDNDFISGAAMYFCVFLFAAFLFAGAVHRIASGNVFEGTGMMGVSAFLLFFLWSGMRPPKQDAA